MRHGTSPSISANSSDELEGEEQQSAPSSIQHVVPEVQEYINSFVMQLGEEFVPLCFSPWSGVVDTQPNRTLSPIAGTDQLDMREVRMSAQNAEAIIGVCRCGYAHEEESVRRILQQLVQIGCKTILVACLVPNEEVMRERMEAIVEFQDAILSLGAADVIVNPPRSVRQLHDIVVKMCQRQIAENTMLEATLEVEEPLVMSQRRMESLTEYRDRLLWDIVPSQLMPELPRANRHIVDDADRVGQYRYVSGFAAASRTMRFAVNADGRLVFIELTPKTEVDDPYYVEDVYREYRFGGFFNHPNIARCIECLHTKSNIHLVFEECGTRRLDQCCGEQPGLRLEQTNAVLCFKQVVRALAFVHGFDVAHRRVCPKNVMVKELESGDLHFTLYGFLHAVRITDQTESTKVCGELPCIAPEMLDGGPYLPRYVDSWSVGVLLLEIAGGLGSFNMSVGIGDPNVRQADPEALVDDIVDAVSDDEFHLRALAHMGGVRSPQVVSWLRQLLILEPRSRVLLPILADSFDDEEPQ